MTTPPPGPPRDPALQAALDDAYAALGPDYRPRTELLGPEGRALYVNRLIREPSPYLRQHAHNPVDWRPWGDAAFAEARTRGVPVFLSVGYATCHWCHVMEEESFDDEEVAAALNAGFVPVKLDREQRPDLDQIYIMATQIQQNRAGWPNSVWMTADGQPFHTGTYFPKPQFLQSLAAVSDAWATRRADVDRVSSQLSKAIRDFALRESVAEVGPDMAEQAKSRLSAMANRDMGGFSRGTQFPQETYLLFLLDHWRRTGDAEALEIAAGALDAIAAGGIHDHVGGGFHRYAVDVNWRTPHFEKMLYNQALLSRAFTEAWEATGRPAYARAATRCLDYVLREMRAPGGAFYTAEDADNLDAAGKREEGEFYVWPPKAARAALGPDAGFAIAALGLDQRPTLEAGPVAHLKPGASVDFAALDPALERMRAARAARNRPIRDEKVIAGWNGLMIRALAECGHALDRDDYVDAAAAAYYDALRLLDGPDGLSRIAAEGERREAAGLEDHAWLGLAALALHDATREAEWLAAAQAQAAALSGFDHGQGMKMTRADGPLGPVRDTDDGALPSGQSSALELLARLGARTPDPARRDRALALLGALSGQMAEQPILRTTALVAARILSDGESGARRAIGAGAATARLRRDGGAMALDIDIAPGWRLADDTLTLSGETTRPDPVEHPAPAGLPSRTHEGRVTLTAESADRVELTVQFCDAASCGLPETHIFRRADHSAD